MIETLREKAAFIARYADHVKIVESRIPAYTEGLLSKYPLITKMDDNHFLSANYVLALDSINFGSGYFGPGLSYEVVARGLKHAFMQDEMNTPDKWIAATPDMMRQMFSLAPGPYDDLMKIFAHHLNATGLMMAGFYDDDVLNLLEEAQGSALRFVNIVGQWPFFRDVAEYKGIEVPLLKRAQIMAADMFLTFEGQGLGAFTDMDGLTMFADNMVPHVLRCDGILTYTPELAARIDAGQEIKSGSPEEVEIRAVALHAVELMRQSAAPLPLTSVNLDHILWHRGNEPEIASKPAHRTKTVWY